MTRRRRKSRTCPDCGITGDSDSKDFLTNGSTRCRSCSRKLARSRYPERRLEIAAKRRARRRVLREAADDGTELPSIIETHRAVLKVTYWIRFGSGDQSEVVGHPWSVVREMLDREGLDREELGDTWEIDFSGGLRFEDWRIRRL